MFAFWRLWLLTIIILLGFRGLCYLLTDNLRYLRYFDRIIRLAGGLAALVVVFWMCSRLLP